MRAKLLLLAMMVASISCTPAPASIRHAYWQPVSTSSHASLRGVHAVTGDLVWATGSDGTVLRTTDGGTSWTRFQVGPGLEIRDVHAFDSLTAFILVVTRPASILRTVNGGKTWEELFRTPQKDAFLDSFTFMDRQHAIVFGDPVDGRFLVFTTRDGGTTWTAPRSIPPALHGEAAFAASGTSVAAMGQRIWIGTGGLTSRVLRSSDGGQTWEASFSPITSGTSTAGIFSVAFKDARHGVLVGGDYTKPDELRHNAAFTVDGGATWTGVQDGFQPHGQRAVVAWWPGRPDTLLTVGRSGTDYSTDGGRTWTLLSHDGYYALSFAPNGEGWAVGADGRAARLSFSDPAAGIH